MKRRLIFSEKDAAWIRFSKAVKVGGVFDAKVGVVEDYGAFVHLCFPDGTTIFTSVHHPFYQCVSILKSAMVMCG